MLENQKFDLISYNAADPQHKKYLEQVLSIERDEGWEILDTDIKSFLESGQTTINFVLVQGICVGSVSFFVDEHSTEQKYLGIGAFIIAPKLRGKGLGEEILKHCLSENSTKLIGIMSIPECTAFYKRLGFIETGHSVTAFSLDLPKPTIEMEQFQLSKLSESEKAEIIAYDQKLTGLFRGHLLYCMLENATVAIASFDRKKLQGYAFARPFSSTTGNGFRISLYAGDSHVFAELMGKIINHLRTLKEALCIRVTSPTYKGPHLASQGFKYASDPCPFLTNSLNTVSLQGEKTWCTLSEEFS